MKLRFLFFFCLIFIPSAAVRAEQAGGRPAYAAGSFYPADEKSLAAMIDSFLAKAPDQAVAEPILGIMAPHAGLVYSGQVAAYAYKILAAKNFDAVILIGPSHRIPFHGASVWLGGDWQTPLGKAAIDLALGRAIAGFDPRLQFGPEPHRAEHSLEMEVIFLQRIVKNSKLVPILLGDISLETSQVLAKAIQKNIEGKKIAVVASSDMSHYYPSEAAEKRDHETLDLIRRGEPSALYKGLKAGTNELCGGGAVLTLLELARLTPGTSVSLLNYAHSGSVTGENSKVVGYSSFLVTRGRTSADASILGTAQQEELLKIAWRSIENAVKGKESPLEPIHDPALQDNKATFVTLRIGGKLRGCIGELEAVEPLYRSVEHNAASAAVKDPRFSPVTEQEIGKLEIAISILSPPVKINHLDEIILGEDGVILKKDGHSGVFLPEVAAETGWDKGMFLDELCEQKAGLARGCWKEKDAEFFIFTTQEFGDNHL